MSKFSDMRLHWLLPNIKGIPVLMYHRVWPGISDGLTITPENLKNQWTYLQQQGYEAISLPSFLEYIQNKQISEKKLLLTFDDGYKNNLEYVYPLLKELNWKATFFIISDTVDGSGRPDKEIINAKMNVSELASLDPEIVQLGLHGHHHESFDKLSVSSIKSVIERSIKAFDDSGLPYLKVLAYPYGARPKSEQEKKELKKWMVDIGMKAAFRIGNQVCKIPTTDIYELKRIDIKGTDSMQDFKIKMRKGKLKPF